MDSAEQFAASSETGTVDKVTTSTTTESGPPLLPRKPSSDLGQYFLGLIMLVGYYALIGTFMLADVQENRLGPVKEILNYMTPLIGVMVGYFFGGALSGRRKDDMIAAAVVK